MTDRVQAWEAAQDRRSIFLACYATMTGNMLDALEAGRFGDTAWVARLLQRFAEYYFDALACYERRLESEVPPVWLLAHEAALRDDAMTVQHLLVGVNAHINYDLVFAVAELLSPEWTTLPDEQRAKRRADYDLVNAIISESIDRVQDAVLEVRSPWLDVVDKILGPVDEWLISDLITRWRDEVWRQAVRYVEVSDPDAREALRRAVEGEALRTGRAILTVT